MSAPPKELIRFLQRFDPAIRELALDARELVLRVMEPPNESVLDVYVLAMNYGFSERMKDQVVYIGVYTKHINLGFNWGARMEDPEGVLQGAGKQMRHISIQSPADLGSPVIRDYLLRAVPEGAVRSKTLKTKIYPSRRTPAPGDFKRKGGKMADNKTKPTELSVSAFIDGLPEPRRADAKALVKLMQSASGENPKMWGPSIVGFGSYHYKYESGREGDMPVVAFSPRKAAIVLYGLRAGSDAELAKLGKHTTGKGCVYVKKLADIDQQALKALAVAAVRAPARS